ncbi:hypothetical protein Tco_1380065 [Tanacetum coccineum]
MICKRSKSENKGKVPTEMEPGLELTQQGYLKDGDGDGNSQHLRYQKIKGLDNVQTINTSYGWDWIRRIDVWEDRLDKN